MPLLKICFILSFCAGLCACSDTPDRTLSLTSQGAYASTISPDSQYALVGSVLHGGSLWRLHDSERLYNWNHTQGKYSKLSAVTFSTDSLFALTAEKYRVVLWDVLTGKAKGFWRTQGSVSSVALSDNGRFALIGQQDHRSLYIDTQTNNILQTFESGDSVNAVAISADGKIGIIGSDDNTVNVWVLATGKRLHNFEMKNDIASVAISRDGSLGFGSPHHGKGKIWDIASGTELSEIGYTRVTLSTAQFSADNKQLVSGDTVRRIMIWDVQTGKKLQQKVAKSPSLYPPSGLVVEGTSLTDSGQLSVIYSNGSVNTWEIANKKG